MPTIQKKGDIANARKLGLVIEICYVRDTPKAVSDELPLLLRTTLTAYFCLPVFGTSAHPQEIVALGADGMCKSVTDLVAH
jgi:hypothetical protein